MSPTQLAFAVIRSAGWYAVAGCALLILFNTASMLVPVALGQAIDRSIAPLSAGTSATGEFLLWAGVIAGLYVVLNLTFRFGGRLGWYGVQRAQYELSERVMDRNLDPRGMAGPARLPGSLLAVATLDVQRACLALYVAIYPLGELVGIVVAAVALFLVHPLLGLTVVVGAPGLLAVMMRVARPLQRRSVREQASIADATGAATDLVTGYRVLAGIHAQDVAAGRYNTISRAALTGTLAARTAQGGFNGTNTVLSGLFAAGVTVVAAALAFTGRIDVGGLIAAAGVAQLMMTPLRSFVGNAGSFWAVALASAERILALLGTPYRDEAAPTTVVARTGDGTRPVLRVDAAPLPGDILLDAAIEEGEFVVLDLPSSAANALAGALSLNSTGGQDRAAIIGRIELRGRPVSAYDPVELRETVLVAPHQADLFEGTMLANVVPEAHPPGEPGLLGYAAGTAADDGAADLRARAALRVAHCEALEQELPQGYDTVIEDAGHTLSGGQRQRVALARAIAANPPILVLQEPTNSVDSVTEAIIADRLKIARSGMTTVVVSSSPAFRAVADRIVDAPDLQRGPR